ncbi:hypothetical protein AS27_03114, partial [Aptenodytes forsteri]
FTFLKELSYHKNSKKSDISESCSRMYITYREKLLSGLCLAETPLSFIDLQALVSAPFRSGMIITGLLLPLESRNYQPCSERVSVVL